MVQPRNFPVTEAAYGAFKRVDLKGSSALALSQVTTSSDARPSAVPSTDPSNNHHGQFRPESQATPPKRALAGHSGSFHWSGYFTELGGRRLPTGQEPACSGGPRGRGRLDLLRRSSVG